MIEAASLSQGTHIVTLRVENSAGEYDEQSIQIIVSLSEESFESDESLLTSSSFLFSILFVTAISLIRRKN